MIQRSQITAKSQMELQMRINELLKRGYSVESVAEPEENEHKHFGYTEKKDGYRRHYQGSDVQLKFRASMVRDYQG